MNLVSDIEQVNTLDYLRLKPGRFRRAQKVCVDTIAFGKTAVSCDVDKSFDNYHREYL